MAGLCGLKTLLLWAGIIAWINCQSPQKTSSSDESSSPRTVTEASATPSVTSHTPPLTSPTPFSDPSVKAADTSATTQAPLSAQSNQSSPANTSDSPTTTSTNQTPDSQSNSSQNQTSPPITTSSTSQATTQAPPSAQCDYTVTPIKFGFQINITSSTNGTYTINIEEEGLTRGQTQYHQHQHSNQSSSLEIQHLKPCTEYKHSVTFIDNNGNETSCYHAGNKTKTIDMSQNDIKEVERCSPGYVCYHSDWNITSSLSASNNNPAESCMNDSKTLCIELNNNDFCSDLTVNFASGNCPSFSLTKSISIDFLNPSKITTTVQNKLPGDIKVDLAANCNVTDDYTCVESGNSNKYKTPSELEPFTDYRCVGHIKDNVTVINIPAFNVTIDCNVTITTEPKRVTNTSVDWSWTTKSINCSHLSKLEKFSYNCSCSPTGHKGDGGRVGKYSKEGKCIISGLTPYTSYTCGAQPTYNNVKTPSEIPLPDIETKPGIPEKTPKVTLTVLDHNVIKVTCHLVKSFYGPKKEYIARLHYDSDPENEIQEKKEEKCDFEFRDLSYLTAYKVKVTTYNGELESEPVTKGVSTQYDSKALIGFLVFLIILTSVALLFVTYKIYILKRRKSRDMTETLMLISTTNDEENLLTVEPIAAEVLLETYKRKLADEGRLFLAEFQSVPRIFSRYTVKEAKKPYNAPKNRYVDILPYDYNRVHLTTGNGETGCDYINASFVDGYKESKKYIAAQGPKDETVSDFWRMIWEQQSSIIVMVTRCEEGNRIKCAQYWPSPERETEIFEEFIVRLTSEDQCPDYTIRRLSLTNKREKNSEREVTHIQFISWPDHGVPEEAHLLLKLRRRVNAFKNFFSGPIVVHCSAGVGRTGTYIGIDAMMEGLEAEGRVDVYGYVVRLRRQRCLMVQVEAQYILIHQALLEHNQFGETEITLSELHSTLSTLKQKNADNEPTLLEDEFERLPTYKNWRTFNTGITEENKKKNRSSSVIPYDYNRVLLKLDEGRSRDSDPDDDDDDDSTDEEDEDSTKYINASHINGYWGPRALIAAQSPLPDTMADFWTMVYQKRASTVVMLSGCSEGDKESDCVYWDKDKKTFGDFEVEVVNTDTSAAFISRNMVIHHVKRKDSRSVKHFQFLKWENVELPEKPQDLTDMIKDIKRSCGSGKLARSVPIVVHCNDGSSRSGIFCALWNVLDSAETEKLVDIFQVAKTLRKERQGMFSSLAQYQFLYDTLEGIFPVQNGEVKAVQASAADSVQIVNETKAAEQPAEEKAEQTVSTTSNGQQGAEESAPLEAGGGQEDRTEEPKKVSTDMTPLEDTNNGPTVTVEG
uniref:receptor-type tyrosine-protein phosphatase C isoform X4 n=1 Tax=Scatophagus argus TaxID=75038 RepID=UPI001ED7D975|nr:receptor-type tyrosine-protein phosphatase C isoform X4 [Scatophagus argus]